MSATGAVGCIFKAAKVKAARARTILRWMGPLARPWACMISGCIPKAANPNSRTAAGATAPNGRGGMAWLKLGMAFPG